MMFGVNAVPALCDRVRGKLQERTQVAEDHRTDFFVVEDVHLMAALVLVADGDFSLGCLRGHHMDFPPAS